MVYSKEEKKEYNRVQYLKKKQNNPPKIKVKTYLPITIKPISTKKPKLIVKKKIVPREKLTPPQETITETITEPITEPITETITETIIDEIIPPKEIIDEIPKPLNTPIIEIIENIELNYTPSPSVKKNKKKTLSKKIISRRAKTGVNTKMRIKHHSGYKSSLFNRYYINNLKERINVINV